MSGVFSATEMCDFNGTANLALKIVSLPEREAASWSSRCCLLPYFLGLERKNLNHPSITKMWTQSESNHSFQIQISSFLSYLVYICCHWGFPDGSAVKNPPANVGDTGSIPGSGRSLGGGNGNPLHILAWEIMDRGPGGLQSMGSQGLSMTGVWAHTQGLPHSCLEPHRSSCGGRRYKRKAGDFLRERR